MKFPFISLSMWSTSGGRFWFGTHLRSDRVYLPTWLWKLIGFGWTPIIICKVS